MIEHGHYAPFLRLIYLMEKRPGMYLGYGGLDRLSAFLNGWRAYKEFNGIPGNDPFEEAFYKEFNEYVFQKFGTKRSTVGWFTVIASETESSEAALKVFFALFHQFHAEFLAKTKSKGDGHVG